MATTNTGQNDKGATTGRYEFGFWAVGFSLLVVMALGTAPSPLYGLYQQRDGFSTFTITLIFAVYSLGSTSSLILAGPASDWLGRKKVLIPGLALGVVSAGIFLWWRSLPGLYTGRFLTGVSVGVVAATATAHMAELHVGSKPGASLRRAQLLSSVANLGGLGMGALVSGLLAQYVSTPLGTVYVVILAALVLAIVAVVFTPETWLRPQPRPPYRFERIAVPAAARGQFFAATGAAAIAFAGLGLFTGLAGVLLVATLHRTSLALAGATVFAVFAGAALMQFLTLSWKRTTVLTTGIGALLIGLGLVVASIWLTTPNLTLFLVGGVIAGSGSGAVFKGSLGTVMMIAEPAHRAESVAGILLAGYFGLSIPAIGLGIALRSVSPKVTLLGFTILAAVAIVGAAPVLLRGERRAAASLGSIPATELNDTKSDNHHGGTVAVTN
jgi:MFS family permease